VYEFFLYVAPITIVNDEFEVHHWTTFENAIIEFMHIALERMEAFLICVMDDCFIFNSFVFLTVLVMCIVNGASSAATLAK
jgi:hypothetical protein